MLNECLVCFNLYALSFDKYISSYLLISSLVLLLKWVVVLLSFACLIYCFDPYFPLHPVRVQQISCITLFFGEGMSVHDIELFVVIGIWCEFMHVKFWIQNVFMESLNLGKSYDVLDTEFIKNKCQTNGTPTLLLINQHLTEPRIVKTHSIANSILLGVEVQHPKDWAIIFCLMLMHHTSIGIGAN